MKKNLEWIIVYKQGKGNLPMYRMTVFAPTKRQAVKTFKSEYPDYKVVSVELIPTHKK